MRGIDYRSHNNDNDVIVSAFKTNDKAVLKSFYTNNYSKVEVYVLQNSGTVAHAKDIYQEAFLAVWKNIKNDKFEAKSESAINGYLIKIAKNKWLDTLRSKKFKSTMSIDKNSHLTIADQENNSTADDNLGENRLQGVMQAFNELGDGCKDLLMQFYFEKKSMKEIAEVLNLDAASVKNKKYRCMQKLKEIALKITQ